MLRALAFLAALSLLTPVAGCKQGVGDRCQSPDNSDCQDGLVCVFPVGDTSPALAGGTCQMQGSTVFDLAVSGDLRAPDLGADLSSND